MYAISGQLYWNGVGLTTAGSLPSPIEGNVMRGNGTTSWQTTDSLYIASSSGYVGIGTTTPNATLAVAGNTTLTGSLGISSTINAPNIGTGVDNSVIVLEADGTFGTDEIDSRV